MFVSQEGKKIPSVTFHTRQGDQWVDVTTGELFNNKTVVVFSLPGAFTPTCSSSHLPRYNELAAVFKQFGVDAVLCVSVNDTFVMNAWKADQDAENITFIPHGNGEFTRAKRGSGSDPANRFLDHGNYLAYGLGATATWVLGLPHGLAILHGKTRRGGLVFDAADLVKDAIILPQAFLSAVRGDEEQEFRQSCIEALTRTEALDFMIETLQQIARTTAAAARA